MSVVMRRMTKLQQRGDTIVEVLIAITIVSLILGGAYVTSHNSLNATEDAQEHANAINLAQAQVELIRSQASTGNPIFTHALPFCLTTGGSPTATCTVNNAGATVGTGPFIYKEQIITRAGTSPGPYTFTVQVQWPGLQNQTNQTELVYRIYE